MGTVRVKVGSEITMVVKPFTELTDLLANGKIDGMSCTVLSQETERHEKQKEESERNDVLNTISVNTLKSPRPHYRSNSLCSHVFRVYCFVTPFP